MTEHERRWETCSTCGKAVYPTWRDAMNSARDMVRLSGKARGLRAYWDKSCRCFHVGRSTTQDYDRARRGA